MQRAPRSHLALALLAVLILAGLGWFQLEGLQVANPLPAVARLPLTAGAAASAEVPSAMPSTGLSATDPTATDLTALAQAAVTTEKAQPAPAPASVEFNPAQTSWENPFHAECWNAPGWKFSPEGMQPLGPNAAEARFRRPYRHLTLTCLLEPLHTPPGPFEVRLTIPATKQSLTLAIKGSRAAITADAESGGPGEAAAEHQSHTLVERTIELPEPERKAVGAGTPAVPPSRLRLVATGHRIVVSWNGRIVARCDQPADYSAQPLIWSLQGGTDAFAVRALRIEGE